MADSDEQFSLCWNNFNSNLSAGFHESLCRGDLVDVTLAAEGQFVKAHRLVLSVCSPYFRKMFTQMPANQHAFVFLKDVSHTALKDLIQFMYCGEVNVKQEALPAFISTAEALQIKGLTDSDPPPSQSPAEPSTPTPQVQQITSPPRQRQRTSTTRSYKIESIDDSGDDKHQPTQIVIQTTSAAPQVTIAQHHQQTQHIQASQSQQQQQLASATTAASAATVVTHKRPALRNTGNAPHIKRTKSTIDPLDTTDTSTTVVPQQITVQTAVVSESKSIHHQTNETEYIDLPLELPTKSEPDYTEEGGEVEATEHDTYVEDDSYGEIRYDDSYFTENEDVGTAPTATAVAASTGNASTTGGTIATTSKAIVKQQAATSFSDSSFVETADQSNNDAQAKVEFSQTNLPTQQVGTPQSSSNAALQGPMYVVSKYGTKQLVLKQHTFNRHVCRENVTYWRCSQFAVLRCRARIKTKGNMLTVLNGDHNHEVITKARKYGSLKSIKAEDGH